MTDPASPSATAPSLRVFSLRGIPRINPGDDLLHAIHAGLQASQLALHDGDVLCVTSKLLSRAEGRFVDLNAVQVGKRAQQLARLTDKDARLVELVLGESSHISRAQKGVLIVRHRLGFVCANAGIDASNAQPVHADADAGSWVLLLPQDPDRSASMLHQELRTMYDAKVGVVITDSHSRAFRLGTVGVAIGCAGLPALDNRRGDVDLDGRVLEHTETALADQLAALADMMAGQGNEGRPVTLIRGLTLPAHESPAASLVRLPSQDLFA